jgi:hypothetical protein
MQAFYQNLSQVPREAMIVQELGVLFKDKIYEVFMSKLKTGKDYLKIGDNRKNVLSRSPDVRKRMKLLDCGPKCIKMNWVDFWCGKKDDGFCPAVDEKSGLLYFLDTNHPSPLGAVHQGNHMLQKYQEFMKKKLIKKTSK